MSPDSPFFVLQQRGLITRNQVSRALAHPQYGELAEYPALADHLVWLVVRGILEESDFRHKAQRFVDFDGGENREELLLAIEIAALKIVGVREGFNRGWFDTLVKEGLIIQSEHARALEALPGDEVLASPAAALFWMGYNGVVSPDRFQAIRASQGGSAERAAILAEVKEIADKIHAFARETVISGIFPGPRWLWIGGALLFVGFLVVW